MSRGHYEGRFLVAAIVVAGLAVVAGPLLVVLQPGTDVLLVSATAAVLLLPIGVRMMQRRLDPFEPIFVFVVAYGVMFVVRPIAEISRGQYFYTVATGTIPIDGTFTRALVLGLLGAIGVVIGYFLRAGPRAARRIKPPPEMVSQERALYAAAVLAAAGAVLFYLFLAESGSGRSGLSLLLQGRSEELTALYKGTTAYLYSAPFLLIPATLILFAFGIARRSWPMLLGAVAAAALLFAILGPLGARTMLFPLFFGLTIMAYTLRGRRPRTITLVAGVLLALFVSNVMLEVRSSERRQHAGVAWTIKWVATHPQGMFDPITKGDDAAEVPALATALTVVPSQLDHTYGSSLAGDLLTRPIPRVLWPGKPLPPRERVISELWPRAYSLHAANPEFTVLLAFYLDFGPVGVFFGMLAFGIVARILYDYFQANRGSLAAQLLFAAAVPFIVAGVRDTPVDTLTRLAFVVVPIVVIFYFVAVSEPHPALTRLSRRRRAGRPGARDPAPAG